MDLRLPRKILGIREFVDENNFSTEKFFEILTESIEIRTNADVRLQTFQEVSTLHQLLKTCMTTIKM